MKEESGRATVWDHAAETGMQDTIRQIAAVFPIDDISIYSPGKLTWLRKRPRKYHRIRLLNRTLKLLKQPGDYLRNSNSITARYHD